MVEALLQAIGGVAVEGECRVENTQDRSLFTLSLMPCSSHPQRLISWLDIVSSMQKSSPWKQRHREEHRKSVKEWKKQNREKVLAQKKRYYQQHQEEILQRRKEYRQKMKQLMKETFGTICVLCGGTQKRIEIHEIHGNDHTASRRYIINHKEDFRALCSKCHNMVHQMMVVFGFTWEQITDLLSGN